jgi:adenine-specific DNA-methyltransferase
MMLSHRVKLRHCSLLNRKHQPAAMNRLEYIGSKYQLIPWLHEQIVAATGWATFAGRRVADLFAGTAVVSHHFRKQGAIVHANDAEAYSAAIAHATVRSSYNLKCKLLIAKWNTELAESKYATTCDFITSNYSPHEGCERMFFTVENARRIDYLRLQLAAVRPTLSEDDFYFLLASILTSADAVKNTTSVYGAYLKQFKRRAEAALVLQPIHTEGRTATTEASSATWLPAAAAAAATTVTQPFDIAYLDPPYNQRQYSKNYFPLNEIAKPPGAQAAEEPLKGKTGIPADCFLSDFCKAATVEQAFRDVVAPLRANWVFISYNSESLIPKARLLEILKEYGAVTVAEREYKRFKSSDITENKEIVEYLFCLQKNSN